MTTERTATSSRLPRTVTLDYFGHCAFLWTTAQGVRALIDPYRNQVDRFWFLRGFPPVEADVVMVTHSHFDHDAVEQVPGLPTILRGACEFRVGDLAVYGVLDTHARLRGGPPLDNVIFLVQNGGIRFCHIGDNRSDIPPQVRDAIGEVDVLMVTVDDSCHLLSYEQVESLTQLLRPRVVIPTHYLIPGLTSEDAYGRSGIPLKTAETWLKGRERVRRFDAGPLVLSHDILPSTVETWVLTPRLDAA